MRSQGSGSLSEIGEEGPEGFPFLGPAQAPDELGRLGRFRVLRLIGAGGIGLVFLAEDPHLKRSIALKVLRGKYARRPEARERFLREARSLAALKHENIATVFEAGEASIDESVLDEAGTQSSFPFLAMELLEGQSLAEWMKQNCKPSIEIVLRIGRQAAAGLAAAHAGGIVHRDIKPANLWLTTAQQPAQRLKILDFGLAQSLQTGESCEIVGTPGYMAPEQVRGQSVDARSDLFALGCVLYELCTGELPFPSDSKAVRERSFTYRPPKLVGKANPTVPVPVAKLIHRLLEETPAGRPRSAQEVERRLEGIERRLWLWRQPRWVRWAGAAALLVFFTALVLGFGPFMWALMRFGHGHSEPIVINQVQPEAMHSPGPPDEAWRKVVANLPPECQAAAVAAKLRELNPGFDGAIARVVVDEGRLTEIVLSSQFVSDLRPLQALSSLRSLECAGTQMNPGRIADLSPLAGLPLAALSMPDNPSITDFSPLRRTKLITLDLSGTSINHLKEVDGSLLQELNISHTYVRDLSPLANMPKLRTLTCFYCPLESLKPLWTTNIRVLNFTYRHDRDQEILPKLKNLDRINYGHAKDFRLDR